MASGGSLPQAFLVYNKLARFVNLRGQAVGGDILETAAFRPLWACFFLFLVSRSTFLSPGSCILHSRPKSPSTNVNNKLTNPPYGGVFVGRFDFGCSEGASTTQPHQNKLFQDVVGVYYFKKVHTKSKADARFSW